MAKTKIRKIKPNPPPWSFLSRNGRGEDCIGCKNRNGCNSCKEAKKQIAEQKNKKKTVCKPTLGLHNY